MVTIEHLRTEIIITDEKIIQALAQRQELVRQIGQLKSQQGKDIVDLSQEKKLFELYEHLSDKYGLQQNFVKRLFKIIIDYSRKVQR